MLAELGARFAPAPNDTQDLRDEKTAIFLVAGACCLSGLVWAFMYYLIFGWGYTTALPLAFVGIVGSSLVVAHLTTRHRIAIHAQILAIILITALIQWSIGGIFDSGFVQAWALLGPIAGLMFFSIRQSLWWLGLYLTCLAVTIGADGWLSSRGEVVTTGVRRLFVAMNLGASSVVLFAFAGFFVHAALTERQRANRLLLTLLPAPIARRLKQTDGVIADRHEDVSVLFADVVGSTPLFANLEPAEVVDWLNEAFTALDDVVERHGLEKLRTMGDNFMVGAGVPIHRDDHATALVACALDMAAVIEQLDWRHGRHLALRFGINSGPVVAGVLGRSRFHYDLFGDVVNVASRMESTSEAGRVHVSEATYELIREDFECEPRGDVEVKGKGAMRTWFVLGPR